MTAKEYLEQLQEIEHKLIHKLEQVKEYDYLGEQLQTSQESQAYNAAVDTYCQYIERQQEILHTLEGLSFPSYMVLYKHYYEHKLFREIAKELGKSRSWTQKKHVSGLAELQAVLDKRHIEATQQATA